MEKDRLTTCLTKPFKMQNMTELPDFTDPTESLSEATTEKRLPDRRANVDDEPILCEIVKERHGEITAGISGGKDCGGQTHVDHQPLLSKMVRESHDEETAGISEDKDCFEVTGHTVKQQHGIQPCDNTNRDESTEHHKGITFSVRSLHAMNYRRASSLPRPRNTHNLIPVRRATSLSENGGESSPDSPTMTDCSDIEEEEIHITKDKSSHGSLGGSSHLRLVMSPTESMDISDADSISSALDEDEDRNVCQSEGNASVLRAFLNVGCNRRTGLSGRFETSISARSAVNKQPSVKAQTLKHSVLSKDSEEYTDQLQDNTSSAIKIANKMYATGDFIRSPIRRTRSSSNVQQLLHDTDSSDIIKVPPVLNKHLTRRKVRDMRSMRHSRLFLDDDTSTDDLDSVQYVKMTQSKSVPMCQKYPTINKHLKNGYSQIRNVAVSPILIGSDSDDDKISSAAIRGLPISSRTRSRSRSRSSLSRRSRSRSNPRVLSSYVMTRSKSRGRSADPDRLYESHHINDYQLPKSYRSQAMKRHISPKEITERKRHRSQRDSFTKRRQSRSPSCSRDYTNRTTERRPRSLTRKNAQLVDNVKHKPSNKHGLIDLTQEEDEEPPVKRMRTRSVSQPRSTSKSPQTIARKTRRSCSQPCSPSKVVHTQYSTNGPWAITSVEEKSAPRSIPNSRLLKSNPADSVQTRPKRASSRPPINSDNSGSSDDDDDDDNHYLLLARRRERSPSCPRQVIQSKTKSRERQSRSTIRTARAPRIKIVRGVSKSDWEVIANYVEPDVEYQHYTGCITRSRSRSRAREPNTSDCEDMSHASVISPAKSRPQSRPKHSTPKQPKRKKKKSKKRQKAKVPPASRRLSVLSDDDNSDDNVIEAKHSGSKRGASNQRERRPRSVSRSKSLDQYQTMSASKEIKMRLSAKSTAEWQCEPLHTTPPMSPAKPRSCSSSKQPPGPKQSTVQKKSISKEHSTSRFVTKQPTNIRRVRSPPSPKQERSASNPNSTTTKKASPSEATREPLIKPAVRKRITEWWRENKFLLSAPGQRTSSRQAARTKLPSNRVNIWEVFSENEHGEPTGFASFRLVAESSDTGLQCKPVDLRHNSQLVQTPSDELPDLSWPGALGEIMHNRSPPTRLLRSEFVGRSKTPSVSKHLVSNV